MHMTLTRFAAIGFGLWFGIVSMAMAVDPLVQEQAPATAIFAGGCFWCMEPPFDALAGVTATTTGFTDGHKVNPSYKEVASGGTGHVEALQIRYDTTQVSYQQLLDVFWRNIDPFDDGGQFCDRGPEYLSAIFYHNEAQKKLAQQSKTAIEKRLGHAVTTAIRPAAQFYAAEDYHQDYYRKNPVRYRYYRYSCGRDQRLEELWGRQNN